MYADECGGYFTITPEHLYVHDKKKLYNSKCVIKIGTPDKEELAISSDGGESWDYSYIDGTMMLKIFPQERAIND